MTIKKSKILPLIVVLITLSLIWANFNLFYYVHLHFDENGHIVVHAHPSQETNHTKNPAKHHSHSKDEFFNLSLIYQILTLFSLIFIIHTLLAILNLIEKIKVSSQSFILKHISIDTWRRGPPALLLNS